MAMSSATKKQGKQRTNNISYTLQSTFNSSTSSSSFTFTNGSGTISYQNTGTLNGESIAGSYAISASKVVDLLNSGATIASKKE